MFESSILKNSIFKEFHDILCFKNPPMIYVHVLGLPVEISEDQNVYNQLPKV